MLLALFVVIERRPRSRWCGSRPALRAADAGEHRGVALFGAYFGFQFVGTLYMQWLLGWSPVETALAFLPAGLLVAFGATRVGPVIDRVGTSG